MSQEPDEFKRWTARHKAVVVIDIIKDKTTAAEAARSHDLTVGEVEQWLEDYTATGTEALRSHYALTVTLLFIRKSLGVFFV